jgi:hypothetical protein
MNVNGIDNFNFFQLIEHEYDLEVEQDQSNTNISMPPPPLVPSPSPPSPSPSPQSAEVIGARLDNHERRLEVLESASLSPSSRATSSTSPPLSLPSLSMSAAACPLGCGNMTGLGLKAPPTDLRKHIQSIAHVEAALCLLPPALFNASDPSARLCVCDAQLPPVTVNLERVFKSRGNSDAFSPAIDGQFCQNRVCLALKSISPAMRAAIDSTQAQLRTIYHPDGSRVRPTKRRTFEGDQTVAVAFAADKFSTPGAVYVVFDAANNQLRVQMKRPTVSTFHVAHVARMHRWMRHVLHFAPSHHKLWDSHVAVADSGFIDAFVIASSSDIGDIDSAADRELLHTRIASGELVLCAGRSDGWLELVQATSATERTRIALPLSHLQPHSFRRFDAQARPSLPLLSDSHAAPLSQPFDVRMQHYTPCQVSIGSGMVKLEMLCKCGGWFLVAPSTAVEQKQQQQCDSALVAAALEEQRKRGRDILRALIDMAELEEMSQQAREALGARQRAIDAIEQAEQLRLQNIALSQRLADAERVARERNVNTGASDNAALLARIAQLERRLAQAKQRESDAIQVSRPVGTPPQPVGAPAPHNSPLRRCFASTPRQPRRLWKANFEQLAST